MRDPIQNEIQARLAKAELNALRALREDVATIRDKALAAKARAQVLAKDEEFPGDASMFDAYCDDTVDGAHDELANIDHGITQLEEALLDWDDLLNVGPYHKRPAYMAEGGAA